MAYIRYEHVLHNPGVERQINTTTYGWGTYFASQNAFKYNSGNYVSVLYKYMEVSMKSATVTTNDTYVQLYWNTLDRLDASNYTTAVTSSQLISSSTTRNVYRTGNLSFTNDYFYAFKARNEATAVSTTVIATVSIVIIDDVGTGIPTKTYCKVPMSWFGDYTTDSGTTSTSYVDFPYSFIFEFNENIYNGTHSAYLESWVSGTGSSSGGYILYDITTSSTIANSEIYGGTGNAYALYMKSSSFTLVHGHKYRLQYKAQSTYTFYARNGVYLIIAQTSPTKTRLYNCTYTYIASTATSYAAATNGMYPPESAHWTSAVYNIRYSRCFKISNASYSAYAKMSTRNSTTEVANSESNTSSTSFIESVGNSSLSLTAGTRYAGLFRSTQASATATILCNFFAYDVRFPGYSFSYAQIIG